MANRGRLLGRPLVQPPVCIVHVASKDAAPLIKQRTFFCLDRKLQLTNCPCLHWIKCGSQANYDRVILSHYRMWFTTKVQQSNCPIKLLSQYTLHAIFKLFIRCGLGNLFQANLSRRSDLIYFNKKLT